MDVIFSCSTNELATERPELNHGVFSYYASPGPQVRNRPGHVRQDLDRDLHSYLSNKVNPYVRDKIRDKQNPQNPDWIYKELRTRGSDKCWLIKPIGSERTITCRVRAF